MRLLLQLHHPLIYVLLARRRSRRRWGEVVDALVALKADRLLQSTDVPAVMTDFGLPSAEPLHQLVNAEAILRGAAGTTIRPATP